MRNTQDVVTMLNGNISTKAVFLSDSLQNINHVFCQHLGTGNHYREACWATMRQYFQYFRPCDVYITLLAILNKFGVTWLPTVAELKYIDPYTNCFIASSDLEQSIFAI